MHALSFDLWQLKPLVNISGDRFKKNSRTELYDLSDYVQMDKKNNQKKKMIMIMIMNKKNAWKEEEHEEEEERKKMKKKMKIPLTIKYSFIHFHASKILTTR